MLRAYRERVRLVITSPPYLDITDYHEDQWLRLWFLGGLAKPLARQGKDDRHRGEEPYWKFMREAWIGIVPLLMDGAQVVVRIGGSRLKQDELAAGLASSLQASGRKFRLAEARCTVIRNGQRRVLQAVPDRAAVEHDFRFTLRS